MARIPPVDPDDPGADPEARRVLESYPSLRNVSRAVANHPAPLAAMHSIATAVKEPPSGVYSESEAAIVPSAGRAGSAARARAAAPAATRRSS